MSTNTDSTVAAWRGKTAIDSDGDKIGTIDEVYTDIETGEPEWLAISTGMFGTKVSFVPIGGANEEQDDCVRVPYEKAKVKNAPNAEADGALSPEEESKLYAHYGIGYSEPAVGHDTSGPTTDDAMTRSEEELRVGTTERESGRVRLRKYIVTENVTKTVPVQREEVRIEREPITDANRGDAMSGPEISEEEHEVVLHEEEVVVEKRVVPKERVSLEVDTVTEDREVSEEIRKEQIETDGLEGRDRNDA